MPVFRWFNRFLKGEDPLIEVAARKYFEPEQLKVFDKLPEDQRNTRVQETFVPPAKPPAVPDSAEEWGRQRNAWEAALKEKCFGGWPEKPGPLELRQIFSAEHRGVDLHAYEFTSQPNVRLRLFLAGRPHLKRPDRVVLVVQGEEDWQEWLAGMRHAFASELESDSPDGQQLFKTDAKHFENVRRALVTNNSVCVYLAPRGIGPTAWSGDAKKQAQIRRRFMLLGQTLDGMRVWDIRRAVQAVRSFRSLQGVPLSVAADHDLAVDALYAGLFERGIAAFDLRQMPASHHDGPDYLNVLRTLDIPQAVAMAAEGSQVRLFETDMSGWDYPIALVRRLGWNERQLTIDPMPAVNSK